ncbi:MAG TPA: rhomboid family intramembrane serine protease [Rhodothermia bacterium]
MFSPFGTPLTALLLLSNLAVSLYALFQDPKLIDRWAFIPNRIQENGEWYRLLSGGFLHGGIGHLAFNMITLYFFGPVLEMVLGTVNFGVLYFGALAVAHLFLLAKYKHDPDYVAVGASGAISGVVFGFCLFFPFEKIYLFLIPIGIPAFVFAIGFAGFSYWASNQPPQAGIFGRVAHEAHLGGALGGLVLTVLLEPRVLPGLMRQIESLF